ncbi:MAG TPA: M48 family metalloprotease [bacterium]|nr:M48 family metalloprotease [bacterium]HPN42648.1 M48 family metalloprotease [bacterium]
MYKKIFSLLLILPVISCLFSCAGNKNAQNKLDFVTIEEEMFLGKELARECSKQLKLYNNQEVSAFFEGIANEIGDNSDWRGLNYSVYIVNDTTINHFSLPGGSIYLYRGLIDLCANASEVAAILAHEIAHIASRDAVDRVSKKYTFAFAAQSVFGYNPEIPKQIVASLFTSGTILDYPQKNELYADAKAIQYVWNSNYDPTALIRILERLRAIEKIAPGQIYKLSLTHPPAATRFKTVSSGIKDLNGKNDFIRDLPEYARIKALILSQN